MQDNDHRTVTWESDPFPPPEENGVVLVELNDGSLKIFTARPFDQGKSFRWYLGHAITTVDGREQIKSWAWIRKPHKTCK